MSSIFGKNPSPSPTGDASPPQPAKSPVAKIRFGTAQSPKEEHETKTSESEDGASKKSAGPSKIGIGVGGNVLAEMKARQERRISGILNKQNSEESDVSEVSDKTEPSGAKSASTSPNPLGGIRLRSAAQAPDDDVPPKLPEKTIRFAKSPEEPDADKSKSNSSLFRLRSRIGLEEAQDDKPPPLNHVKLRSTANNDDGQSLELTSEKANPLSGVRLRSTGINVAENHKTGNGGDGDNKSESRNSLTKLKPPPLAPKPRPWSVVGSDKKNGKTRTFVACRWPVTSVEASHLKDADACEAAKENDVKEVAKLNKVRAMAAAVNQSNTNAGKFQEKSLLFGSSRSRFARSIYPQ